MKEGGSQLDSPEKNYSQKAQLFRVKNDKKLFLFHLKISFRSQDF